MTIQNTVNVQRQWSKTIGQAWFTMLNGVASANPTSTDALKQFFDQLNAVIQDTQNTSYVSAALTSGATTAPSTGANWWGIAGGVYVRVASGGAFPAAGMGTTPVTTGNFGLYWFTIDSTGTQRSYVSAGTNAATRAGLTFPNPLPGPNEVVVGAIEVAPSGATFTPGTTNLNAANINATVFNFTGDTGFTAMGMQEMSIA